jgi:class 3 adenylate cyclase
VREFHYRWEWRLEADPEALWPLAADTDRFNRDAGVPALDDRGAGRNARRRLRLSRFGIAVEWEEEPFEWVRPHRFSVVRRYLRGPVAEMRVSAELRPRDEGGTLLVYDVSARPRNLLGRIAIPIQIGRLSARRFEAAFRRYDRLALAARPLPEAERTVRFAPGGLRRLAAARDALLGEGAAPELTTRLAELVEAGDELTLQRLRPYELADRWDVDRRGLLELFLLATRAGLLELRWDLLCPLCRGARESGSSLGEISGQVHCDTCNIDFTVNFDRSVELSFRPSASICQLEDVQFCVGGPQLTPHVVAQQLLASGEARALALELEQGRHRLRALELGGSYPLLVADDGAAEATLRADEAGWPVGESRLGPAPAVRLENGTDHEQLFVLERTAWSDEVVTAAEVTAMQMFRDLFATEALRPGEPIAVGSLTVLFTDLRDSTRFYREVGDAPAFGSVMDHLDLLRDAVSREGGAVVKSMGDAIMAVFTRPLAAVSAALAAQQAVADPGEGRPPLLLKAGIHTGPCIAVNQNGRLDYFGSTVNLAARLVALSSGSDVVVSEAVVADPEVSDLLAGEALAVDATRLEAALKGFDDERFELWRFRVPNVARVEVGGARSTR